MVAAVLATACSTGSAPPATVAAGASAPSTSTTTVVESTPVPAVALPAGFALHEDIGMVIVSAPGIRVEEHSLSVTLPDANVAARVNAGLADLLDTLVDELAMSGAMGDVTISHDVLLFSSKVLSVRWIVSGPDTLWVETSSYDLSVGAPLRLSSALVGTNALILLSDLVSRSLIEEVYGGDADALADFADPVLPRHIAYATSGIQVSFDPGEVAATGTGVVTVQVPWSELGSAVRADGPFADYRGS